MWSILCSFGVINVLNSKDKLKVFSCQSIMVHSTNPGSFNKNNVWNISELVWAMANDGINDSKNSKKRKKKDKNQDIPGFTQKKKTQLYSSVQINLTFFFLIGIIVLYWNSNEFILTFLRFPEISFVPCCRWWLILYLALEMQKSNVLCHEVLHTFVHHCIHFSHISVVHLHIIHCLSVYTLYAVTQH